MANFTNSNLETIKKFMVLAEGDWTPTFTFPVPFVATCDGTEYTFLQIVHTRVNAERLNVRVYVAEFQNEKGETKTKKITMTQAEAFDGIAEGLAANMAALSDEQKARIEAEWNERKPRTQSATAPTERKTATKLATDKNALFAIVCDAIKQYRGVVYVEEELNKANRTQTNLRPDIKFYGDNEEAMLTAVRFDVEKFATFAEFNNGNTEEISNTTAIQTLQRTAYLLSVVSGTKEAAAIMAEYSNNSTLSGMSADDIKKVAKAFVQYGNENVEQWTAVNAATIAEDGTMTFNTITADLVSFLVSNGIAEFVWNGSKSTDICTLAAIMANGATIKPNAEEGNIVVSLKKYKA